MIRNRATSDIIFIAILVMMAVTNLRGQNPTQWILGEILMLPGIIIALSFHEFAHAFVSTRLGDPTPKNQGRVTINPLAHLDLPGFVALVLVGFGWGKPVEINPHNYKNRRVGELLVAVAGVTMNLILAIVFTFVLKAYIAGTGTYSPELTTTGGIIYYMIFYCIYINLVLMVFNLLPIPPLDGFNIVTGIFDLQKYPWWGRLYDMGMYILLLLIFFGMTSRVLTPCVRFLLNLLFGLL